MWLKTFFKSLTATSSRPRPARRSPPPARPGLEALEERRVPASFATVMSGLDNPRGLAFGPDGGLYVVEAGRGGDGPSIVLRPGVVASYGPTGAVSRLLDGRQERVAAGLPSLFSPDGTNGPHDVSFQADGSALVTVGFGTNPARRAELGDAGDGFGQLVRLQPDGTWQNVIDLADYEAAANPDGGLIDSNLFGVLAGPGGAVVVDAGGNSLLRVTDTGDVSALAVFPTRPARATDSVPTDVVIGPDGAYYVSELTGVPFAAGAANIYRVAPGEAPQVVHTGFKTIIDLDFGPDGSLYVLQHATGPFLSGSGALIRIAPDGARTPVQLEGLTLTRPTSVLVADDGALYVTNRGISVGTGEVIRIALGPARIDSVAVNDGSAQRSMVNSLTVTFDRVVTPDAGAFELHRQGGGLVDLSVATSVVSGRTVAVLTFAGQGVIGGSLADGRYTLTVRGDRVHDGDGTALDGDGDGAAGGDRVDGLFRLFGDSDGDGDVDRRDRKRFRDAHKTTSIDIGYLWYLDFDGDGDIDGRDNGQFHRRFRRC